MRKFLFLFFLGSIISNAQLREKGTFEVIPTIGYSSSYVFSSSLFIETTARESARFGVTGDYYFSNRWSLRSGLLQENMGARGLGLKYDLNLNYLTIPVNANWHFGKTRKWNLNFGLTPAFLTSAEFNGDNIKEEINPFQLGLSFGIGYKLEFSKKFSLLFDYQINSGMSNILKEGNAVMGNGISSFNIGGVFNFK